MYTQCSKCETVFKLSAEVLRAAGGQVRCGKCGEVFNALARLAEDAGAFETGESSLDLESRADSILESVVAMQVAEAAPDDVDEFALPGVEIAHLQILDNNEEDHFDVAEQSMEFTLPPGELDRIFIESKKLAPPEPADPNAFTDTDTAGTIELVPHPESAPFVDRRVRHFAGLEISEEVRREMLSGLAKQDSPTDRTPRPDLDSLGRRYDEPGYDPTGDDDDARSDAARGGDEPRDGGRRDEQRRDDALRDHQSSVDDSRDHEPRHDLPRDHEPRYGELREDEPLYEQVRTVAPANAGRRRADRRSAGRGPLILWLTAAIVSALLLLAQIVHTNREWLIAHGPLGAGLGALYATIGAPVSAPANLSAYQLRQWGVTGEPDAAGTLRVRASILNTAAQLQPYPLLRVTLANRFGSRIGARDFEPSEYLGKPTARLLAPGERVDAILDILDPGKNAEGFEIDVCLRQPDHKISCASDVAPQTKK